MTASVERGGRAPATHALLPLHAYHLPQRMDDLDEIGLRRHDRVDVLVGARRLVDDAFVLPALDMGRGFDVVGHGEAAPRFVARHGATGAMRAGLERIGIALAAHDEGLGPIEPGMMPS